MDLDLHMHQMMTAITMSATAAPAAIPMIRTKSVGGGGAGGEGGGSVGGIGAATAVIVVVIVDIAVMVMPSASPNAVMVALSYMPLAADAAAADGAITEAWTCTLPELTIMVISRALMPLPRKAARLDLKAVASNASTVPSTVTVNARTGL